VLCMKDVLSLAFFVHAISHPVVSRTSRIYALASHAEGVILDPPGNPAESEKCRQALAPARIRKEVRI
jgi:hypothetical protein